MSTQQSLRNTAGTLSVPATLAHLLDSLDYRPRGAHAGQYRAVASGLAQQLDHMDRDSLEALLNASPAAAEIYENLHYAHAGLCRSDLEAATRAEMLAREAIDKAARRSP
ncbi:MAG: hypothetical protein ACM3VZ_09560 [Acidobacteriota bacterium]